MKKIILFFLCLLCVSCHQQYSHDTATGSVDILHNASPILEQTPDVVKNPYQGGQDLMMQMEKDFQITHADIFSQAQNIQSKIQQKAQALQTDSSVVMAFVQKHSESLQQFLDHKKQNKNIDAFIDFFIMNLSPYGIDITNKSAFSEIIGDDAMYDIVQNISLINDYILPNGSIVQKEINQQIQMIYGQNATSQDVESFMLMMSDYNALSTGDCDAIANEMLQFECVSSQKHESNSL